jgi:uncharacterized protein
MNTFLRILLLRNAPFWTVSRTRRWLRRVTAAGYVYLAILAVLLCLEGKLLFAGATFAREWRDPPAELSVREVELLLPGGGRVTGWFTAPEGWKPEQGAIVYSHGNGGNLSTRATHLRLLRKYLGRAVLGHDYPGYGKSPGTCSEAGCYAAGDAAYNWLVEEMGVPRGEILLVGESMGGAVAVDLATRREHRMLITLGAFTSFPDMAGVRFPWLPGRYLVRNRLDNLSKIAHVRGPVFIAHGTADTVVPFAHGQRLAAAAVEPKRFVVEQGGQHNCLHDNRPAFWNALNEFLDATRSGQ